MEDFEKLGVFYLGKRYDLENARLTDELVLYDSRDLVTHAVCVGMTGSGKTGLCVGLLEEAAIDGVPAIVVDPKGDLANLLLTFPDLEPEDFLPWINEEDARKHDLTSREYASDQAELWRKGLSAWGQDGERIRRLKEAAEFAIYTPGSSAGTPVSILKSFEAPGPAVAGDPDLLRERVSTTVTGLLSLLGIDADPIKSREHILLSTILDTHWSRGQGLDIAGFINAVQSPPFTRVGVFELESFFPSKERFELAMKVNNLLAAPGFAAWLEGEPLDIDSMLYTREGKPKVSIISIAHLPDAERMFFVSLLLTQLLGWMRSRSGTTSLRALFYMDEIFGYFPPVANPPSKEPLMTLLKQARAFGVGIVLATQNPVDLDYKGLSNTGTWFIGRLQTERDKMRVLEGLEGASGSGRFDRAKMERTLAGLGKRVFLMHNVNEDEPVTFQTRWAISYLRGPLTRSQIKELTAKTSPAAVGTGAAPAGKETAAFGPAPMPVQGQEKAVPKRPVLPPGISQCFVPAKPGPAGAELYYEPALIGSATLYFASAKAGVAAQKTVTVVGGLPSGASGVDWDAALDIAAAGIGESDMAKFPETEDAYFGELTREAGLTKSYRQWAAEFKDWLYRSQALELLKSPSLNEVSEPGEDDREFRIRLRESARQKRDELVEKVRTSYAPKMARLEERIRRSEQALDREKEQARQQKMQTAVSFGATLLGALMGRKTISQSSVGRAATTMSRAGRVLKEQKDVAMAQDNIEELRRQLAELQGIFEREVAEARDGVDPLTEKFETLTVKPKKSDIAVSMLALAWLPYWQGVSGEIIPAWTDTSPGPPTSSGKAAA